MKTNFDYTQSSFNDALNRIKSFSDRLYVNKQLQNVILDDYSDVQEVYNAYNSLKFLEEYLLTYREISSFRIYTENYNLLDNQFIVKTSETIKESNWYSKAIDKKGQAFWIYDKDIISKKNYLSIVRSVWSSSAGELVGVLVINVNPEYIKSLLSNPSFDTYIYLNYKLLYNSSHLISGNNDQFIWVNIQNSNDIKKINKISFNKQKFGLVGNDFIADVDADLKFKIAYLIPYSSLIKGTNVLVTYLIVMILVFIILSSFVNVFFSKYISKRVIKIQKGISSVVENNFEIPESIGGQDEFESIYRDLYEMSNNIKNLIDKVYTQNLEKEQLAAKQNEISFKMLSSQINPHFLFNSLETIRMKALSSGEKEVAVMLRMLASLLRYNLSVKGQPVPLFKEIDAIQNYLNIQHMRFGERISFDVITLLDIQNKNILPLLIQPIVENSFNHGLEDRVSGGFIYIIIELEKTEEEDLIKISIKDNGKGISEEKLKELRENLENIDATSIGLINVNTRIKLYYGKKYGLEIESKENEVTTVILRIPVI